MTTIIDTMEGTILFALDGIYDVNLKPTGKPFIVKTTKETLEYDLVEVKFYYLCITVTDPNDSRKRLTHVTSCLQEIYVD